MTLNANQRVEKLKQALAEMRQNKDQFSDVAFSQIMMLLLEELRDTQTGKPQLPAEDEIRLVTVMFIDIKDSTEMVQQFEAGDWKLIVAAAHEQIADVVAQWDGQIGQYLGDGVLCFFGAQRSRGDDAPHAVSCALQIQSVMGQYAQKLKELHNIEFGLRIGISTGRVIVGMIGSQTIKQELLALGPATNLAARLQGIAPVGGVLVDGTTFNRIRRDYITQAQAPVALKGFDELVNNYLVLGRRTQPATQFTETHISGIEIPLVGRDDDLASISYICDRALTEVRCEVITLVGDIGMGKSRLLQETIHLTEGHFTPIVMTSQYEGRLQSQNLLWDMLITQCHLTDGMPADMRDKQIEAYITEMWRHPDAARAAQAISYLAGFSDNPPDDDPAALALRWFAGVANYQPIILIVDNLQWTDDVSISLLEQIATKLEQTSSVIINAGRPDYQTIHPTYMSTYSHHKVIELRPLRQEATLLIIKSIFEHVERVPKMLASQINERVEGNPLFVQEYMGMMFDNNIIKPIEDNRWRFNIIMLDAALNTLPNSLLSILQARIDDLPTEARQVLQAASISGRVFWKNSVATLLNTPNIDTMLDNLVLSSMVVVDDETMLPRETQYRFRHELYHNVAYEMIPRAKREEYHHIVAFWLLERLAGHASLYALLAEQFMKSQQPLAALQTYLEAVEVMIGRKQEKQALTLIDTSLSITNQVSREEALPLVIKLWACRAQALTELERYEEASAASQSALMLLEEVPKNQFVASRITANRILGLAHLSLGRFNPAYDALTNAYNLLPVSAAGQIGAVLSALGKLYYYQGRLEDSYAYQRRAYESASSAQDLPLVALTLRRLGLIHFECSKFATALDNLNEALKIHRALDLTREQSVDLFHLGVVQLNCLAYGKAYEYFSDADYLNTFDDKYDDVLVQAYRAFSLIALGRATQGKALLSDAMNNPPKDIEQRHRLQLVNISALSVLEEPVQVRDRALTLIQQESLSSLIKARAQRWLGRSSYLLGTNDAVHHLQSALLAQEKFNGRDLWLCYAMLGECIDNEDEKHQYYQQSARYIQQRIDNLIDYPDLVTAFLSNTYVQAILEYAS